MTNYKCFTKCVKDCEKIYKNSLGHTNKNCHLKKFDCCCSLKFCKCQNKELKSPEKKNICEVCCCVVENCTCKKEGIRQKFIGISNRRKTQDLCKCCKGNENAAEPDICTGCCYPIQKCICKKSTEELFQERPKRLIEDLPLYDEKSHLLGYIKSGSVIDMPICSKSRDRELEVKSSSDNGLRMRANAANPKCMASCRYADGIRNQSGIPSASRWTTRSAFVHATTTPLIDTWDNSQSRLAPPLASQQKHKTQQIFHCVCCKSNK